MRRALLLAAAFGVLACKGSTERSDTEAKQPAMQAGTSTDDDRAAPPDTPPAATGPQLTIGNDGTPCRRTLCIAGPGPLDAEPNRDLAELCRQAPGVLRRCEGKRCQSAYGLDEWQAGLDALITQLDRNADGKVDQNDEVCSIELAGWSQGAAVVAGPLIDALASDPRMASERVAVEHMVLVAPYDPAAEPGKPLEIPELVEKAWIYRHTATPSDDCSNDYEGGPWLSPAPVCSGSTQCWDYDYSKEPALAFLSRRGARSGAAIGHCNIMAVVAKIGLDNLARGIETYADMAPLLSDGRPGGRPREEGPPRPKVFDPGPED